MDNVTFMGAFWNEEERLPELLDHLDPYFKYWSIAIQESTDRSLEIALPYKSPERFILPDRHRGLGEASYQFLLNNVTTEWVFVVSGDEWPQASLLDSLPQVVKDAEAGNFDGVYVPMRSWIEEFEFTGEQDAHLRLFRKAIGWPSTMHSRPMTDNIMVMSFDHAILHKRTLSEMMLDYLRYYEMGRGEAQWEAHNEVMMRDACVAIAERKGWDFVQTQPWWDQVAKIAF